MGGVKESRMNANKLNRVSVAEQFDRTFNLRNRTSNSKRKQNMIIFQCLENTPNVVDKIGIKMNQTMSNCDSSLNFEDYALNCINQQGETGKQITFILIHFIKL